MKVAYLGPKGTYSDLALREFLKDADGQPQHSIALIFSALVEGRVDAALVPLENLIQGPVTESLDCLREHHRKVEIHTSFSMRIEHALGRLPAKKGSGQLLDGIKTVYSHRQPLEQCGDFFQRQLPSVELSAVESTAAAVELLKRNKRTDAAVIGAEQTLRSSGLDIIQTNLSGDSQNKTRFALLLRRGDDATALKFSKLKPSSTLSLQNITSIVIFPGRDRQGLLFEILEIISVRHRLNLCSIHSRPDRKGGFVFHIDIEGKRGESELDNCLTALRRYCTEATGETAEISVFGSYPLTPFEERRFSNICIVGGNGSMAKWFEKFFADAGFNVKSYDRDSKTSLKELIPAAEVILLSVPMSQVKDAFAEMKPFLRSGQLLIENCSIKDAALPLLEDGVGAGIEVLGMHTMFGPSCTSVRNQNVVFTSTVTSGSLATAFEKLFYKFGANVTHASAEEHDRTVALFQSLLHVVLLSLAEFVRNNFADQENLGAFSTPNSRELFRVMSRVLNQSDELIADLQLLNTHAANSRRRYIESLFRMVFDLEYGNLTTLVDSAKQSREALGDKLKELI